MIQAILAADMIVIGPGSLYTSLMPNLLVPDLLAAIRASKAMKAYIVNIATQRGETAAYTCSDHIRVFEEHVGPDLFDVIVYNNNYTGTLPDGIEWVKLDQKAAMYPVYGADVLDAERPWHHDSSKLAESLMDLLYERKGPLALGNDD